MTAILAALAILVVKFVVPDPLISRFHSDAEAVPARLKEALCNPQLLRLNYGIFALHAAQMAMFVVVPFAIQKTSGMGVNDHWKIYLPILLLSFVLMLPAIIVGEKRAKLKLVFVSAVALMLFAQLLFATVIQHFWGIVISMGVYFVAFNILEASLPSIISKVAPAASKGTAMGVYNTAQSLGIFVGGLSGGYLSHFYSASAVFLFCSVLTALWLFLAVGMQAPPAVKSKMYRLGEISATNARTLSSRLSKLTGVRVLKVDMQQNWDEQAALELISRGS
jgi:predicted MFS family arabinose efflux permease